MLTRRRLGGQSDVGAFPFYALLAAAYPVVFLFAANAAEQFSLDPLWVPLALAVTGTALVLAILWAVTRDPYRAGLLTLVLVIGFFGYGHAWNAAAEELDSQWPFLIAWLLAIGILFFAAWRIPHAAARRVSRFLNVALVLLLVINVWSLGTTMASVATADDPLTGDGVDVHLQPADPDDLNPTKPTIEPNE